jgi:hypothetical protein
MTDKLPRVSAERGYFGFVSGHARRGPRVIHIAECSRTRFGWMSRFGTALCPVHVGLYPESGDLADPAKATCPKCKRIYARLEEAS